MSAPDELERAYYDAALMYRIGKSLEDIANDLSQLERIADALESLAEMTRVRPK